MIRTARARAACPTLEPPYAPRYDDRHGAPHERDRASQGRIARDMPSAGVTAPTTIDGSRRANSTNRRCSTEIPIERTDALVRDVLAAHRLRFREAPLTSSTLRRSAAHTGLRGDIDRPPCSTILDTARPFAAATPRPAIVAAMSRPRTSRQHYDVFRRDYREGTLDDKIAGAGQKPAKRRARHEAPRVPARLPALALAPPLGRRGHLRAGDHDGRARDDRAAVHAVHHRSRAARHRGRDGGSPAPAEPRGRRCSSP